MTSLSLLTPEQKEILVGSLLGDANLQTNTAGRTWRLRMIQKNKDYLFYKYEIFKNLCGSPPIKDEIFDKRTGKTYERWYFNSLVLPCLRHYGNLFYAFDMKSSRWIKHVPYKLSPLLTPRAIAFWYMDDGALKWKGHSNAVRFCTDSFSIDEVNRLRFILKEKFDLETTIQRKNNKPRISINEKHSQIFHALIFSYLHPSMKYKLSDL
uniref:LAGLIDADG homing endonuclease n=1 Tax=Hydrocytium acuminatum TaxID=1745963 RepID=UPI002A81711A|nr:LAGLIDADG homing endonuclease [Hydrocytium acuminatum]WOR09571.1 LAGLIDADG homing endonuclease [Hydrocytium acuminatum]